MSGERCSRCHRSDSRAREIPCAVCNPIGPAAPTQRCRSCNAPVEWVRTATGRAMPLDAAPVERGNVRVVDGVAVVGATGSGDRVAHFVTCPQAKTWRCSPGNKR